jgi:hypothetical protein
VRAYVVVLPHVEVHETTQGLDALQRVQIEPGVLEGPPERLDHRVGERDVDLGQSAPQALVLEHAVDVRVDVLAAGICDDRCPPRPALELACSVAQ